MNKIIVAILLALVLIVGVMCIYELMYIQELGRDMERLSVNIQQLEEDTRMLSMSMQDMKYEIKTNNKALDLILAELWLARPQVPDPRPWQAGGYDD